MTPSEQFKLGFLTRCVEEGLSDQEIDLRVKQASGPVSAATTMVANSDYNPLKLLSNPGAMGTAGAVGLAGAATVSPAAMLLAGALATGGIGALGYGLGSRAGYNNKKEELQTAVNPASEQQSELLNAYDQHGKLMQAEMLRKRQTVKPKTRSFY